MDVSELKRIRARGGSFYYEKADGEIVAKECRSCKEVVSIENFGKDKRGIGGRVARCIPCRNKETREYKRANRDKVRQQSREYYQRNKEIVKEKSKAYRQTEEYKEYSRNYYKENRDRILKHKKKWRENNRDFQRQLVGDWERRNPDRVSLKQQRRRARKASLPDDFTPEQMESTLAFFGGGCALTGSRDIEWDHVIPISLGVGGTTESNMIPLRSDLNKRKSNLNLFEWFKRSRDELSLSQEKFDRLISFLSKKNGMTVDEYRSFYYAQFKNKEETA